MNLAFYMIIFLALGVLSVALGNRFFEKLGEIIEKIMQRIR